MKKLTLDKNFLLGTASSSTQIEGGDTNNTWYKWCLEGHILDGSTCLTACDHWNRVEEDTELLKSLNIQTYRMSLEWSRVEPEPGQYSPENLNHYRKEIELLIANGIEPLVTLHHFSEPLWFHELGGWLKPGNSDFFLNYTRYVAENLGDLVKEWVTFNEPNVYVFFGYALGLFPPGERDLGKALQVLKELIKTHIKVYELIHEIRQEKGFSGVAKVGTAHHLRVFDGVTFPGKITAGVVDYFFNKLSAEGFTTGKMMFPLKIGFSLKKGRYADFLGINYYTRNIVEFVWEYYKYFHVLSCDDCLDKTDLGWDIYPEGIYRVCKKYYERYRLPIYITENGISDQSDRKRPQFIVDHLAQLMKAKAEGAEIERYYYWSQMDNFEWLDGEQGFFGLYHCDFRTQKRTARKSAELYARLSKEKEISI